MKVKDISKALETLAPKAYQESYDNAGLITGHQEMELTGVLFCLDSTVEVIQEAIDKNCNMVVAHHPIVFKGLKQLNGKNYVERVIIKAIKNDIAIYAIHTNLDNVRAGVNDEIADQLGLTNRSILMPKSGLINKLEFYCPSDSVEQVKAALFEAGAGQIGQYDFCAFTSEGKGSYRPLPGSKPSVGVIGEVSIETESRVEIILPRAISSRVISALKSAHPYEEVAYQLISLDNAHQEIGSGIIGDLPEDTPIMDFLVQVKEKMEAKMLRHTAVCQEKVRRIAVIGGSGSFGIMPARARGADVLITSDVKYHEFFDAEGQLVIADIGHYETEHYTSRRLQQFLSKKFPSFALLLSEHNTNPVNYL